MKKKIDRTVVFDAAAVQQSCPGSDTRAKREIKEWRDVRLLRLLPRPTGLSSSSATPCLEGRINF